MASNRIVRKITLVTIQKASQQFVLEAATETQTFKRSEAQVNAAKSRLIGIVQNSDKLLPTNTAKAVVRWVIDKGTRHRHSTDLRWSDFEHGADNHIDVVCFDEDDKYIKTEQIVPKKWRPMGYCCRRAWAMEMLRLRWFSLLSSGVLLRECLSARIRRNGEAFWDALGRHGGTKAGNQRRRRSMTPCCGWPVQN